MNLNQNLFTIDIGNSHPHIGTFSSNGELINVSSLNLESKIQGNSINSNVTNSNLEIENSINIGNYFKNSKFLDMPVNYSNSLGQDRLAMAYYAFKNFAKIKKQKVVVIDSGTFTTIDLITENGFMGGEIQPGLNLIFDSYSNGVLLNKGNWTNEIKIAQNTEEAINQGAKTQFLAGIAQTTSKYSPDQILITGGSSEFLANEFPKALIDKHLIHHALFLIYKSLT